MSCKKCGHSPEDHAFKQRTNDENHTGQFYDDNKGACFKEVRQLSYNGPMKLCILQDDDDNMPDTNNEQLIPIICPCMEYK